jgi:hypothetical protein
MLLPHIDALASHAPPDTDTQDTAYLLNIDPSADSQDRGAWLRSQPQDSQICYLRRPERQAEMVTHSGSVRRGEDEDLITQRESKRSAGGS